LGTAQSFQFIQDSDDQNSSIPPWGDLCPLGKRQQPAGVGSFIIRIDIFHDPAWIVPAEADADRTSLAGTTGAKGRPSDRR
jgi:hypothetical protein